MIKLKEVLFTGAFPYEDCYALRKLGAPEGLVPDLDWFFSSIAGFAQHPESIQTRTLEQIERYLPVLRKDFFETFPEHRLIAKSITQEATPRLFAHLSAAEELRPAIYEMLLAAQAKAHYENS